MRLSSSSLLMARASISRSDNWSKLRIATPLEGLRLYGVDSMSGRGGLRPVASRPAIILETFRAAFVEAPHRRGQATETGYVLKPWDDRRRGLDHWPHRRKAPNV